MSSRIVHLITSDPHELRMSQDYAAILCSLLGAIVLVSAVEAARTQRTAAAEKQKLRLMFADEIRESAVAHRTGAEIPAPRRVAVRSAVRIYRILRAHLDRMLNFLYVLWAFIVTAASVLLCATIGWSAGKSGDPARDIAWLDLWGAMLLITFTGFCTGFRYVALRPIRKWEERMEVARRMGLSRAETTSLVNAWARHHGTKW
ncbi:hypothetical protein [Streptomyces sp. YKOK-J1]